MGKENSKDSIGISRLLNTGWAGRKRLSLFDSPTSNVDQVFTLANVICFLYYNFRLRALGGQDHRQSQAETPEVNSLVLQVR